MFRIKLGVSYKLGSFLIFELHKTRRNIRRKNNTHEHCQRQETMGNEEGRDDSSERLVKWTLASQGFQRKKSRLTFMTAILNS